MNKLIMIMLFLACATSFGVGRINISDGTVTSKFDYNSESYTQTLTQSDFQNSAEYNPLESGIDFKLITDSALRTANKLAPNAAFEVIAVSVKKMPNRSYWFVLVELGETISMPNGDKTLPAFQLSFTVTGKCGHIVNASK